MRARNLYLIKITGFHFSQRDMFWTLCTSVFGLYRLSPEDVCFCNYVGRQFSFVVAYIPSVFLSCIVVVRVSVTHVFHRSYVLHSVPSNNPRTL